MADKLAGGLKFDSEKPMLALLDPYFLEEVAKVMTFGKEKYGAENWREGLKISRIISSLLRHVLAFMRGEDLDSETQLSHLAHAAANCMFIYYFVNNRKDLDDRFYSSKKDNIEYIKPDTQPSSEHNPGIEASFGIGDY